jgi:tRNA(Ile)-lysidine synthase TilS/MesJ/selenocysteine lyase/cysteine desulfurase
MFRHEAREMVKRAVGATDKDAVLFLGNGATGAANSLVHFLQIPTIAFRSSKARAVLRAKAAAATGGSTEAAADTAVTPKPSRAMEPTPPQTASDAETAAAASKVTGAKAFVSPGCMAGSFSAVRAVGMSTAAVHFTDEAEHSHSAATGAAADSDALDAAGGADAAGDAGALPPLVLVGPYAHHSSLLPWKEAGAEVVILPEAPKGMPPGVDLAALAAELVRAEAERRPLTIGVLAAASNITGILVDTETPTAVLHAHGALAVFDYAAAAPHAPVVVNPATGSVRDAGRSDSSAQSALGGDAGGIASVILAAARAGVTIPPGVSLDKDAAYFSPHKFAGGPGSPGVLVVKKALLANHVPAVPGGGTVFFVNRDGSPRYLANVEEREEGGTPNITGAIRAGLVMRLHSAVGPSFIRAREAAAVDFIMGRWSRHPGIQVLGKEGAPRAAIFSIVFPCRPAGRAGSGLPDAYAYSPLHNADPDAAASGGAALPMPVGGTVKGEAYGDGSAAQGSVSLLAPGRRFLHWGFAATVLADLFGIQARGGCLCAGPYALRLLNLGDAEAAALEERLLDREELLRPGFVRLSVPYHVPAHAVRFIVAAVEFVATHGVDLLPLYTARPDTGEWQHWSWRHIDRPRKWMHMISFEDGTMSVRDGFHDAVMALPGDAAVQVGRRQEAAARAEHPAEQGNLPAADPVELARAADAEVAGKIPVLAPTRAQEEAVSTAVAELQEWLALPIAGLDAAVEAEASRRSSALVASRAAAAKQEAAAVEAAVAAAAAATAGAAVGEEDRAEIADYSRYFAAAMAETRRGRAALKPGASRQLGLMAEELEESLLSPPARELRWFALSGETVAAPVVAADAELSEEAAGDSAVAEAAATRAVPRDDAEDSDSDSDSPFMPAGDLMAPDATDAEAARLDALEEEARQETLRLTGRATLPPLTGSLAGFNPRVAHFVEPPARLLTRFKHSVLRYKMIWPGDRVMLGLSGGKDSLTCLHLLAALRKLLPFDFEIHACTIDPQSPGFDPTPLIGYCRALGVPYHLESDDIIGAAGRCMDDKRASICAFCSRMKRGMLYSACRREGCNVLALAQHMDDLAESLLMSAFHNGLLRTMKAHYSNAEGDVRVIRPLVQARERDLRDFAETSKLPVIEDNCPACFAAPTERYRMKQLLRAQEQVFPGIVENIGKSLEPLLKDSSWPKLSKAGLTAIRAKWPEFHTGDARTRTERRADRRRVVAAARKEAKMSRYAAAARARGAGGSAGAGAASTTASIMSHLSETDENDEDAALEEEEEEVEEDDAVGAHGQLTGLDGDDIEDEDDVAGLRSPGASAQAVRPRFDTAGLLPPKTVVRR